MLFQQRRPDTTSTSSYYQQPNTSYLNTLSFDTSISSPLNSTSVPQQAVQDTRLSNTQFNPPSPDNTSTSYMPTFNYSNPAIRIQQSTPLPQSSSNGSAPGPLINTSYTMGAQAWDQYSYRKNMAHRRGPSTSSIAPSSPASPYTRTQLHPTKSEQPPVGAYMSTEPSRGFSNLPTPTDTPTSDSFATTGMQAAANHQNFGNTMSAHFAMRDLMTAPEVVPDTPEYSHSGRHSVSSYNEHEAPTTPHTVSGDEYDYKPDNQDTLKTQHTIVPKFDRTLSDMLQDELFPPVTSATLPTSSRQTSNASLLSPYSNSRNLQERLMAANQARAVSPSSRDASPYRQSSTYAQAAPKYNPRYTQSSQSVAQPKPEVEDLAMKSHLIKPSQEAPKSVSPKDTILEYRETEADSKVPLFSEEEVNQYESRYNGVDQNHTSANTAISGSYNQSSSAPAYTDITSNNGGNWAVPQHPSTTSYSQNNPTHLQHQPEYNGISNQSMQMSNGLQGLSFVPQGYRNVNSIPAHEDTPEFPAHLTSMESSMSEAPTSSQNSSTQQEPPSQKPGSSLAETGTYSCTYHGCALRFATPQKLQKHKREAHRTVVSQPPSGIGSGMTSAQLLARNSQAGPHRCDRINPTTGKSCATIFSRPYDLTRHEDTIHNARKQKVRCALCVEEKTFSRNDALTRHMRVVHPEVDFPGKHRRRGTGSD